MDLYNKLDNPDTIAMVRTVLKFGGTSLADLGRISHVADLVAHRAQQGGALAVIVSAISGETDKLISLAHQAAGDDVFGREFDDEHDVIVSSGEQIASGLLALALRRRGLRARSWLGWQMRMNTCEGHGGARINGFATDSGLSEAIDSGEIAVVAGFQGVTSKGRISTLGRGGSDTTAVALAAALNAAHCDIYTDVKGVYTTDPRIVPQARRLDRISYEEMLEMSSLGARVLHTRSVELAMNHKVVFRVLSSFLPPESDNPGTWICSEDEIMEKRVVNGVTYSRDEAKITLYGMEDKPGISAKIFEFMAREGVNVDMIVQAGARGQGRANMVFTCTTRDSRKAEKILRDNRDRLTFDTMDIAYDVAKVSIVGIGMKTHTGVAETMFGALYRKNINIDVIATSEIKISVLIDADYTELAVRALHTAFNLDAA